jgi:DNA-binding CsgD family transcriptional regulator
MVSRTVPNESTRICLISRLGGIRDIAPCCALLSIFRFVYDEASWEALPAMFEMLFNLGAMQLSLVENRGLAGGPNILAFCVTIFVTDAFCREARTTLPPYMGLQVTRRYLAGKLPVLDHDQVAFANARTGVNVLMCHSGKQSDYVSFEHLLPLREKMAEAFRLAHHGYRLREFLAGSIGEETLHWMLSAGFRFRRDYLDYYQAHNLHVPELSKRPWLVGLSKEEALADYGSRASGLFVFTPPRFNFNRSERAILSHSLAGETDEEMAANLSISHWTVKKRWQAIYERVAQLDKGLLPSANHGLETESRGAERRRHLLAYLRQHLEELRPLNR